MKENDILIGAGLTAAESKVYLTLLDIGSSLAGNISKKSGIHRRSVYDILDRLIEKGLIGYIKKNNRKWFEITNPERLIELLKEKEDNIKDILPGLQLKHKMAKEKQETHFYKGKEGVKTVFEDQIKEGKEILIFGASKEGNEMLKYYFPHFDKRRIAKKIKLKVIFDESARNTKFVRKIPLSKTKFVPKEFASPTATNIYGDKVSIIIWSDNPMAILIAQKEVANGYRKYFELMWKIAKD
ncbi:TrmB family transcriptional regulator [Nanoarchaeota archaeon]